MYLKKTISENSLCTYQPEKSMHLCTFSRKDFDSFSGSHKQVQPKTPFKASLANPNRSCLQLRQSSYSQLPPISNSSNKNLQKDLPKFLLFSNSNFSEQPAAQKLNLSFSESKIKEKRQKSSEGSCDEALTRNNRTSISDHKKAKIFKEEIELLTPKFKAEENEKVNFSLVQGLRKDSDDWNALNQNKRVCGGRLMQDIKKSLKGCRFVKRNYRQRIRVLDHRLPKNVFTVNFLSND